MLEIGALVEQSIQKAIAALSARRPELGREVINSDKEIDRREVELEDDCHKVLALHQPVAADLRFIVTVIKVNSALERMGDLACNIARAAINLPSRTQYEDHIDLLKLADLVRDMVRRSLNSLVKLDVELASDVLASDDEVDAETQLVFNKVIEMISEGESDPAHVVRILLVSRHLERIADHTTNIAEDVIFLVEGEIVRHLSPGEMI